MKKIIAVSSLALLSMQAFAQQEMSCVNVTNAQIESLFERWNNSLKTGDAKIVSDNYVSDAVLLPTVSNKVRLTDAERVDYFEHFLEKKPTGKIESRTIRLGCNKAIDSGVYKFTFSDKSEVTARYTFTYTYDGKVWKISSHHSSAMPED